MVKAASPWISELTSQATCEPLRPNQRWGAKKTCKAGNAATFEQMNGWNLPQKWPSSWQLMTIGDWCIQRIWRWFPKSLNPVWCLQKCMMLASFLKRVDICWHTKNKKMQHHRNSSARRAIFGISFPKSHVHSFAASSAQATGFFDSAPLVEPCTFQYNGTF